MDFFACHSNRIGVDPYYNNNLSLEDTNFRVNPQHIGGLSSLAGHSGRKILLVAHNLREEGAPLVQLRVVKELHKRYEFAMLSGEGGELEREYRKLGIPVILWQADTFMAVHTPEQTVDELRKLAGTDWFETLQGTNLIYANTSSCFWGILLSQVLALPSVWGIHESLDYRPGAKAYLGESWDWQYRACFAAATRVVFVANATMSLYASLSSGNFTVIHNAVPEKHTEMENMDEVPTARDIPDSPTPFHILTVGTICERKGQLVLCKAVDELRSRMKEKGTWQEGMLKVTLVGARDNLYQSRVREWIREKKLEKCIDILPYVPHREMERYYRRSDLLVCPSFEESSPLVILEAMEAGLPVVASHVFGIPELIRSEREGILVPPGDEMALAEAMERLMEDPDLRSALAENAMLHGATFFSGFEMMKRYEELFQMCIAQGYICPA